MIRLQLLTSWSKQQTCVFLDELQKYPMLYDQTHPLYQFRAQRLAAIRKIIERLRPVKPNMTPKLISNKIRSLKCQYWKEKKDIRISSETRKPGEPVYKPKLWCFKLLGFLDKKGAYETNPEPFPEEDADDEDEQCYINESTSNAPVFEEVDLRDLEAAELSEETEIVENGQTRNKLHKKCLKLVDCLTREMKSVKSNKVVDTVARSQQSPNTFLGLMVESELSKVTEEIYDDAKWKIIRILEEASKKNLEAKLRPVQINFPSTSASSSNFYNQGGEQRLLVNDSIVYKTPI